MNRILTIIIISAMALTGLSYYNVFNDNIYGKSGNTMTWLGSADFDGTVDLSGATVTLPDTIDGNVVYADTITATHFIGNLDAISVTIDTLHSNTYADTLTAGVFVGPLTGKANYADSALLALDIGGATISGTSAADTIVFTGAITTFNHNIYVADTVRTAAGTINEGTSLFTKNNSFSIAPGGTGAFVGKYCASATSDTVNMMWFGSFTWPGNTDTLAILTSGSTTGAVPIVQSNISGSVYIISSVVADSFYIVPDDSTAVTGRKFYYHVLD